MGVWEGAVGAVLPVVGFLGVLGGFVARAGIVEIAGGAGPAWGEGSSEDGLADGGGPDAVDAVVEDAVEIDEAAGPGEGVTEEVLVEEDIGLRLLVEPDGDAF